MKVWSFRRLRRWQQTPGVNSFGRFGVSPRAIRLHVGLEDVEMLWADLENALTKSVRRSEFKNGSRTMKRLNADHSAERGHRRPVDAAAALAETTIKMVEVITSPPRTELLKKQIAEFEKANPDTKVEIVSLPWGQAFEKFLTHGAGRRDARHRRDAGALDGSLCKQWPARGLGPYMAKDGQELGTLGDRAKQFGSVVKNKQYMIPYGYYIRAMFWNKKLFAEAGLKEAPKTLDEFMAANKKISAIQGKYGYCLRGGPGGFNGMQMFMNIANGKGGYFNADGTSTLNEPRRCQGPRDAGGHLQERLCAEG